MNISKLINFIPLFIPMARKCKDCPKSEIDNEIKSEEIKYEQEQKAEEMKQDWKKAYFFPREGITIYARSYSEAKELLLLNNN